jgi:TP901 family phage tail tape measure protein
MTFALGTATGRIVLDYDGSGAKAAEADVKGLQKTSVSTSQGLRTVSRTAGIAGLAIAAGLGVAVNAAADFEQRISAISAVSGATGDDLDALRNKALQLGKDTQFSATEAAQAIEELVKAGLSSKDVLNGAADAAVNLAAAGEIDIPQAATIASNAMNQFALAAQDLPNVADKIAGAANASAIDVADFGMSLSQVGAVANLAGVSFDDTATAIALMGNAGIKGSDAGTSLKSMFMRLQPTTKKQADEMERLGIITENGANRFYDANGNIKDMSKIAGVLSGSLAGMTKQQKQATLQTLFGSDAIRAAAILTRNGAKGFDKMATSIGKVKAADVAAKRMDNFRGSLEQMKGSLETAGIAIGTIILPYLRMLVDAVTKAANWFLNLSDTQQKWIAGIAVAMATLLLLAAGIIQIILLIGSLSTAFAAIGAAGGIGLGAILGPALAVIAIIALVAAAIYLLWNHSEKFRDIVLSAWADIQVGIQAFLDFFTGQVWPEIKSIIDLIMQSWDELAHGTDGALSQVRAIFGIALNLMLAQWTVVWNLISGVVQGIWTQIKGIILGGMEVIKGIINLVMGILSGDWGQAWEGIKQILHGAWVAISAIVRGAAQILKAIIIALWATIKNFTSAAWNVMKQVIIGAWNVIKSAVSSAGSAIKGAIIAAWNAVKSATSSAWSAIKSAVTNGIVGVMTYMNALPGKILGALAGLAGDMYSKGVEIIQSLINGIGSMAGALADKAKSVIGDGIGKLIPGSPVQEGPLRVLNGGYAGKQIVRMLVDGINAQLPDLQMTVGEVAGSTAAATVPVSGRGGVRKGARKSGGGVGQKISGWLTLKDGRAYIEGIAAGVDDDDSDYDDTVGRMN